MIKPTLYPEWASGDDAAITEPSAGAREAGWTTAKPPHQHMNWLFNAIYSWISALGKTANSSERIAYSLRASLGLGINYYAGKSLTASLGLAASNGCVFFKNYLWVLASEYLVSFDPRTMALNTDFGVSGSIYLDANGGAQICASENWLWITMPTTDEVKVVDPDTEAVLATISLEEGDIPRGIAYDGLYIWVACSGSDKIKRLTKDFAVDSSYALGDQPEYMDFDGTHMWVASYNDHKVYKFNVATLESDASCDVGNTTGQVRFDGEFIWVAVRGSNTVKKITVSDATVSATITASANGPYALAFDGKHIWEQPLESGGNIDRINIVTNAVETLTLPGGYICLGSDFDGTHVLFAIQQASGNSKISKLLANF